MTESKAFWLILAGGLSVTTIAVLGMAAIGLRGPVLSLGAVIPLAVGCNAISRVVMHYGESGRRNR